VDTDIEGCKDVENQAVAWEWIRGFRHNAFTRSRMELSGSYTRSEFREFERRETEVRDSQDTRRSGAQCVRCYNQLYGKVVHVLN
jgi:hypothetical protein